MTGSTINGPSSTTSSERGSSGEKQAPLSGRSQKQRPEKPVGIATAMLATDYAKLITGETVYVDGGYHIVG